MAMEDLFEYGAVLFESDADEEGLRIECAVTPEGELRVMQESAGPLTEWCFEESPHRIETVADADATDGLLEYFHLEARYQLPAVLRMEYTGYDCARKIRSLMKRLELPYRVIEAPVLR